MLLNFVLLFLIILILMGLCSDQYQTERFEKPQKEKKKPFWSSETFWGILGITILLFFLGVYLLWDPQTRSYLGNQIREEGTSDLLRHWRGDSSDPRGLLNSYVSSSDAEFSTWTTTDGERGKQTYIKHIAFYDVKTTEETMQNLPQKAFTHFVISPYTVESFLNNGANFLFYQTTSIEQDVLRVLYDYNYKASVIILWFKPDYKLSLATLKALSLVLETQGFLVIHRDNSTKENKRIINVLFNEANEENEDQYDVYINKQNTFDVWGDAQDQTLYDILEEKTP